MTTIESTDKPAASAEDSTPAVSLEELPKLYAELRRLARAKLADGGHYTLLDTTALVHESYLRLRSGGEIALKDPEHLLAYATKTMRSVIVDYVRRRKAERHGGKAPHTALNSRHIEELGASEDEILDINDSLEVLEGIDPRLVKVVEMRFFGGLTDAEIGRALGVTDRTVRRDWDRARLLLAGLLGR
jgi:RNA polymerase sigma factor (TIGR02999 family)